ncbi:hypothetical protein [Pseudomonas protegens]|nr:hypothetical protein [Pseudomonas protegens]MDP9525679.1 hypothetical protein [Pseudomonas protegens]
MNSVDTRMKNKGGEDKADRPVLLPGRRIAFAQLQKIGAEH